MFEKRICFVVIGLIACLAPASASAAGVGGLGAQAKVGVADVVIETLAPIRTRYEELIADPAELDRLMAVGAGRAAEQAEARLRLAKERMGFLP